MKISPISPAYRPTPNPRRSLFQETVRKFREVIDPPETEGELLARLMVEHGSIQATPFRKNYYGTAEVADYQPKKGIVV